MRAHSRQVGDRRDGDGAELDRSRAVSNRPQSVQRARRITAVGKRSDAELLAGIRAGDRSAWEELVPRYAPRLWAIARARGLDPVLAEDVVQTTWITLVDKHHAIRSPGALGGWLCRVARNEAIRVGKGQARSTPVDPPDLAKIEDTDLLPLDAGPVAAASAAEIWAAVGKLEPDHAEVIRLRYAHHLSYQEIAEITGRADGGVGPTLRRAKLELARHLTS